MEEQQAAVRPAEKDSQMFRTACSDMKSLLTKIYEIKQAPAKKANTEALGELKNQFLMHVLTLKKLNRLDKIRVRNSRDQTVDVKAKVDTYHLQLQNLLYEVLHLQKEVTKCLQYRSADEDIDLVSVKEFMKEAPDELKDKAVENEHSQRLARLEYENIQRKELTSELGLLEKERSALEVYNQDFGISRLFSVQ